jgi:hypothetical protein
MIQFKGVTPLFDGLRKWFTVDFQQQTNQMVTSLDPQPEAQTSGGCGRHRARSPPKCAADSRT